MNGKFPETTTTLPVNPKILIHLRGLGVLCFSEDNKRAEIGYLDIGEGHNANIKMINSSLQDVIEYQSMRGKTLEIRTPNEGMGRGYAHPDSLRNFDRMIDLSDIYGDSAEFKSCVTFQSRIFIDEAIFHTDEKSLAEVTPFEQANPANEKESILIGRGLVGRTTGEEFSVYFDGKKIPLQEGERYIISILSTCPGGNESDFQYYYDILDGAVGPQVNIKHTSGVNSWLTDFEFQQIPMLADTFSQLNFKRLEGKDAAGSENEDYDERKRQEFLSQLMYLRDVICTPEPCLKVTFANRPRSLPPDC